MDATPSTDAFDPEAELAAEEFAPAPGHSIREEEEAHARRLAERYRLEFLDMGLFRIDQELFRTIPAELMLRYGFVPFRRDGRALVIVVSDPTDLPLIDELAVLLGMPVRVMVGARSAITLMREMMALCERLAIGRLAGCNTPSMRYLTITASSCVSMWMSLARRWIAVNTIESTRRMIGLLSLVSRSTVMSSLESSSLRTWIWNPSLASSRTRC